MQRERERRGLLEDHFGLGEYRLFTELLLPDREAHYSKFLSVYQHLANNPETDWVFFVDCDAFFTNFEVSIADLVATYATDDVNFVVAEDTGVFKRSLRSAEDY